MLRTTSGKLALRRLVQRVVIRLDLVSRRPLFLGHYPLGNLTQIFEDSGRTSHHPTRCSERLDNACKWARTQVRVTCSKEGEQIVWEAHARLTLPAQDVVY